MAESFRYDRDFIEGVVVGHVAIVHGLLERGADGPRERRRARPRDRWRGRADIAELLTEAGAEA